MKKSIEDFIITEGKYKGKLDQKAIQTGEDKGTFKSGHPHPSVEGLFYYKWWHSREYWVTQEALNKYRKQVTGWQNKNKERCNSLALRWHYQNREKANLGSRDWKKRNKEHVAHYTSMRRAKSSTTLTDYQAFIIKLFYSHASRVSEKLKIIFEVDHIVPIAKGGLHHPSNLQVVPAKWNRSKGDRNSERWLPSGF